MAPIADSLHWRRTCHPDVVTKPCEVGGMDEADNSHLCHLGSAHGAGDSRDPVSWLGSHLLDLPTQEAPLQERVQVRFIYSSLPCAQVGAVDSERHPQYQIDCQRR
jgi:hypothetical protein